MKNIVLVCSAVVLCAALVNSANAQCCGSKAKVAKVVKAEVIASPQTKCPIMGDKVNPDIYADVNGKRVYVCCKGCIAKVTADPDAALATIKANGETVKVLSPVILCGKCGEVKGTKECCAKDAVKCKKCGLNKGAPGCCKMDGSDKNMAQCPVTGKLMACPSKSGKCNVATLKAACAAGKTPCGMTKCSAPKVPGK